jgi:large subunit ribosomal protein L18
MKQTRAQARKIRTRANMKKVLTKPRLTIFRSNRYIYAQLIDGQKGKTILGVSEREFAADEKIKRIEAAKKLGSLIAKKAIAKKIKEVIFDRGAYKYHGRVKAVAEGAREGGLKF